MCIRDRIHTIAAEYPQEWVGLNTALRGKDGLTWRVDPAICGPSGVIADIGTHVEYLISKVTGLKPVRVLARLRSIPDYVPVESDAQVLIDYEDVYKRQIIDKKKIQITFWRCCAIAGASTAVIGLLNAFSAVAGKVMTLAGISNFLSNLITENISSRVGFLLMINVIFLFMGTFMDINATILIMTPLLLPVAQTYGIDPIHFGACLLYTSRCV